jgi:hypothetical protein
LIGHDSGTGGEFVGCDEVLNQVARAKSRGCCGEVVACLIYSPIPIFHHCSISVLVRRVILSERLEKTMRAAGAICRFPLHMYRCSASDHDARLIALSTRYNAE